MQVEYTVVPGDRVRFGRVEMVYWSDADWPSGVTPEWETSTVEITQQDWGPLDAGSLGTRPSATAPWPR